MKLSLFSAALLLLAAGSDATPLVKPGRHHRSKRQDTCVVRSTNKTIKAVPEGKSAAGAGSTTPLKIAQSVGGTGSTTPGSGSTTPGSGSTTPGTGSTTPDTGSTTSGTGSTTSGSGSTTPGTNSTTSGTDSTTSGGNSTASSPNAQAQPATGGTGGFCNTVFNTGAPKNSGWPNTWSTLAAHGVQDWIGFALNSLSETDTYNTGAGPAKTTPDLNAHQTHVLMDGRYVNDSITLIKTNPPNYLELYNEPDYSFEGFTPLTNPADAANQLAPLFAMPHPQTTYISPALADATSLWLDQFFAACNGCIDQIPIIAVHVYSPDVQTVMDRINKVHSKSGFSGKDIWITELSPASSDCTLDPAGIITWMNTLIGRIHQETPFVKKIFWNCGEHGGGADGLAGGSCNPSLTNDDGSANSLLDAYSKVCGGGS